MVTVSSPSSYHRTPRDRSRVVCIRCHARKVKCDLLVRRNTFNSCTNCEKRDEHCQRREHNRRLPSRRSPNPATSVFPLDRRPDVAATPPLTNDTLETPSALEYIDERDEREHRPNQPPRLTASVDRGYIGESSVMSNHGPLTSESTATLGSFSASLEMQAVIATGADQLPPQSMIDASSAAYFKNLYHRIPVMDRQDITALCPSTLLLQSVCFVGSFLRHPKSTKDLQKLEEYYARAKMLFFLNQEKEPLTTLKALCFFTLWNVKPPSVVTIDCSWNWLGLAMRLATQMGLHRESTHLQRSTPSCARRIAWYLYAQDKMQAACFGRPQMLRTQDFDLRPLSLTDFSSCENDQARSFILWTELAKIYARMLSAKDAEFSIASEEVLCVLGDLRIWALSTSADFRICDDQGNKIYRREYYEYLACYLTCIITYFHNFGKYFQPSVASRISLVASSCIIGLYQEMDYHDDINYLTAINNWSMMAASLPQLDNIPRENHGINAQGNVSNHGPSSLEELDTLLDILRQRGVKFPGSKSIVSKIEHLKLEALSQHNDPSPPTSGPARRHLSESHPEPHLTVLRVHELFPFPKTLSSRLELLDAIEAEDAIDGFLSNYADWSIGNMFGFDDIDLLDYA
ncbi:hypothetical protein V491_00275 [Pseudogymnoascus sp. VKM F-3775]|nr:hypothetical protein V491_00275 [Pseudogymnoascus sp. VKM F-3775]